jgi:hypothetical protein
MYPTSNDNTRLFVQRSSRVPMRSLAAAVGVCVLTAGAGGCGPGSPQPSAGPAARTLGSYSASAYVTRKYGIAEWRATYGPNWVVMTGYGADGNAARGVEMSWFSSTSTAPGHTRLKMLDGSAAVLRRTVNGGQSGHLSDAQFRFVQAMRSDLMLSGASPGGHSGQLSNAQLGLHRAPDGDPMLPDASLGNRRGMVAQRFPDSSTSSLLASPDAGPRCLEAQLESMTILDLAGCLTGVVRFVRNPRGELKDPRGLGETLSSCVELYSDQRHIAEVCAQENEASCSGDPPTCNFEQNAPTPEPQPPGCDKACLCANLGTYFGEPCNTPCVNNFACAQGEECHYGSCGPAPAKDDHPTEESVSHRNLIVSCDGEGASANPIDGVVLCSRSTVEDSSSGGASNDPGVDDLWGGAGPSASCLSDGAPCSEGGECCVGTCTSAPWGSASACGVIYQGDSDGSFEGVTCWPDGAVCTDGAGGAECCSGTCDGGTCGAA